MAIPTRLAAESAGAKLIEKLVDDAVKTEELALDPAGFRSFREGKRRGLYWLKETKDSEGGVDIEEVRIGDPLDVIGKSRNRDGMEWGLWLRWIDADRKEHLWAVPASMFAGDGKDIMAALLSGGWHGDPQQKKQLLRFLASINTGRKVRCVDRVGWYEFSDGGLVFVMPDSIIGKTGQEIVVLQTASPTASYACRGTLEGQREMFKLCMGNSFLMFSLAVGFAGPLLFLAGMESGGFNIHGASSSGKSTTGHVAGSLFDYYERLPTWRSTDNALESMCALRSDGLMLLDELREAPSKSISQVVYMVANGRGKARAKADASIRQPHEWRTMILSTGEMTITARIESSGERAYAGHAVRLADIPADAGAGVGVVE
ncbi:MAG: DUF927 domain-containing protein, partial [Mailhella sp.]|nr:DUF927 domain-containing protein [Mailhella sp.]